MVKIKRAWFDFKAKLFLPPTQPDGRHIKALLSQCPMPKSLSAACNKRHFVWRYTYWLWYLKPDLDNASAYWELIIDNTEDEFWLAATNKYKVSAILHRLLTE